MFDETVREFHTVDLGFRNIVDQGDSALNGGRRILNEIKSGISFGLIESVKVPLACDPARIVGVDDSGFPRIDR
jgi:hypothetical protein